MARTVKFTLIGADNTEAIYNVHYFTSVDEIHLVPAEDPLEHDYSTTCWCEPVVLHPFAVFHNLMGRSR